MRNVSLKLFSLVIAVVLASYVHSESNISIRTFTAPVELQHAPKGKIKISPLNPSAQVTVKGPEFLVSRIPLKPPVFLFDVPPTVDRRFKAKLESGTLALPPSVEILNIEPPELELQFDDLVQREIPVVIPQIGVPPSSVQVSSISFSPQKVLVSGPENALKSLQAIETEPLDLRDRSQSFDVELPFRGPANSLIKVSADVVEARIDIAPFVTERHFERVEVEMRGLPKERASLDPSRVSVVIRGVKPLVQNVKPEQIVAYIAVESAHSDRPVQMVDNFRFEWTSQIKSSWCRSTRRRCESLGRFPLNPTLARAMENVDEGGSSIRSS